MKHKVLLALSISVLTVGAFAWDQIDEADLYIGRVASAFVQLVKVTGDAHNRFTLDAAGIMNWGSGSAAPDTNLYRAAANELQTDDTLDVVGLKISDASVTASVANQGRGTFNICGDNTTVNNNTVYYGPDVTLLANTSGGQTCDINAAGDTTEATADAPILTNQAFQVLGMTCRNEGDANANLSYTLRSAAAATTPSVTCTIADGERDCVADIQTTTNIAAGATVAIAAASTSNVGDNTGFVCQVSYAY